MNWSAAVIGLVPVGVVTVTSTVPVPGGAVATSCVDETTAYVAGVLPNVTAVAPASPVPKTVTAVPPEVGPELGLTRVTAGGER